jgi:hypothetical protein
MNAQGPRRLRLLAIPGVLISSLPILACSLCWPGLYRSDLFARAGLTRKLVSFSGPKEGGPASQQRTIAGEPVAAAYLFPDFGRRSTLSTDWESGAPALMRRWVGATPISRTNARLKAASEP